MTSKRVNLIVDASNMLWKARHTAKLNPSKHEPYASQLIFGDFITDLNQMFMKFNATGMIVCYEGRNNWRKAIYSDYKNRDLTDLYYEDVDDCMELTKEFFSQCSSVKIAAVTGAEADDVIAVTCQNKTDDVENIIISSDRDFVQLLKVPNVKLYSPQQDTFRESTNPDYDLFLKCIRGDASDNIKSAYPRVRETKLESAFFGESIAMVDLLETKLPSGEKVGDIYTFNRQLIDLEAQPQDLRNAILKEVLTVVPSKFSQSLAIKFCRDNKLPLVMELLINGKMTKMLNSQFVL